MKNKKIWFDVVLILLAILTCYLLFFNGIFQGKLPGPLEYANIWKPWHIPGVGKGNYFLSDQVDSVIPRHKFIVDSFRNGVVPFWCNSLTFGKPIVQLFFLGHLYPTNIVSLLFNTNYFLPISSFFKIFLIFISIYFLLRNYKVNKLASAIGGLTASFSLCNIVWIGSGMGNTLSSIPLLFLSTSLLLKFPHKKLILILVFFAVLNTLLSGFPASIFHAFVLSILYYIIGLISKIKDKDFNLELNIINPIIIGILCILIFSPLLYWAIEFFDFIDLSYRTAQGRGRWALRQNNLSLILFPEIFGNYIESSKAGAHPNENCMYASIVMLLFVFMTPVLFFNKEYRNNKIILFWGGVGIWAYCMAFNLFGILSLFKHVPIFNSNPNYRLNFFTVLAVSILGAFNLDFIIKQKSKILKYSCILFSLTLLTVFAFITLPKDISFFGNDHIAEQYSILAVCILSLLILSSERFKTINLLIIGSIIFLNSYSLGKDYNSYYTKNTIYPKTKAIQFLIDNQSDENKLLSIDRTMIPHMGLYRGISSLQSHFWTPKHSIKLLNLIGNDYKTKHETQDFYEKVLLDDTDKYLDFFNVRFVLTDKNKIKYLGSYQNSFSPVYSDSIGNLILENNEINKTCLSFDCGINQFNYNFNGNYIDIFSSDTKTIELPVNFYPGWVSLDSRVEIFKTKNGLIGVRNIDKKATLRFRPTYLIPFICISLIGVLAAMVFILKREL